MPDLEQKAGIIRINEYPAPSKLEEKAEEFKSKSPNILERAKEKGQDVVIFTSSHGTGVIVGVGVGVAAAVTLAILGGVKIYQHQKKS